MPSTEFQQSSKQLAPEINWFLSIWRTLNSQFAVNLSASAVSLGGGAALQQFGSNCGAITARSHTRRLTCWNVVSSRAERIAERSSHPSSRRMVGGVMRRAEMLRKKAGCPERDAFPRDHHIVRPSSKPRPVWPRVAMLARAQFFVVLSCFTTLVGSFQPDLIGSLRRHHITVLGVVGDLVLSVRSGKC